MYKLILDLLQADNFYGVSKNIDIAKGINHIPQSSKEALKQLKRILKQKNK